jgi:hypothetical protein
MECAQYYLPDDAGALTLGASDLADTGSEVELVLFTFRAIAVSPPRLYDGEAEGMVRRSDIARLLAPRPAWAAGQAFADALSLTRDLACLVAPSAPLFNAGVGFEWNVVYYVGRHGQIEATQLPGPADLSEIGRAVPGR